MHHWETRLTPPDKVRYYIVYMRYICVELILFENELQLMIRNVREKRIELNGMQCLWKRRLQLIKGTVNPIIKENNMLLDLPTVMNLTY